MKRKTLLSALIASLLLGLGAGAVHAQNKTVIKLGWTTTDGAQDPYAIAARAFKSHVEAASKGSIEV